MMKMSEIVDGDLGLLEIIDDFKFCRATKVILACHIQQGEK